MHIAIASFFVSAAYVNCVRDGLMQLCFSAHKKMQDGQDKENLTLREQQALKNANYLNPFAH